MQGYVKRRGNPPPGSIPQALDMFRCEVLFYRQIAPVVGVRVPACHRAEISDAGTLLVLEDLSGWHLGADPVQAVVVLAELHRRWEDRAHRRWPWLRPVSAAAPLVGDLYDAIWPSVAARRDLSPLTRHWGERLVRNVVKAVSAVAIAGPLTLAHGDAALRNMRTGEGGEIALLDWEDVSAAPGVLDLAWLLLSSVEPARWAEVIAAYGHDQGMHAVLPAVLVQGLLSLSDCNEDSTDAMAWDARIQEAARYLDTTMN